jgi:hypothetical protein
MTIYLFKKEDNIIYGYHIQEIEGTIPFETKLSEEAFESYFSELQTKGDIKLVNGKLETVEVFDKMPLQKELIDIYQWFLDNDYIPNKIITGEWVIDDVRWKSYLLERQAKRTRQDEIKVLLGE